jgi:hypothetical protein
MIALRLGTQKGTNLIKAVAEARGNGSSFEPSHGLVSLFHGAIVVFQVVV